MEHRDLVCVQSYPVSGDKKPVQQRCRVTAAYLDRQLGEIGEQELHLGVAVSEYPDEVKPFARSTRPRLFQYGVLQQEVLYSFG